MNLTDAASHDVSDSVQLTLITPEDAPALFALTQSNRARLREWLPWVDGVKTEADTLAFIHRAITFASKEKVLTYIIRHQGVVTGAIDLGLNHENRYAMIGYWLAKEHEGQGLVIRSCVTLLSYVFLNLEFHRVVIRVAPANTKSRAIPQKLGFRIDGTLRESFWMYDHFKDEVVYSLLKREWEQVEDGYPFV